MTKITNKEWVEKQIGREILSGMPDEVFDFYYRVMHDYGMDFYDGDRYAWLNTLFGYDIGADRAMEIITWYDDNGGDVLNVEAESGGTLKNICELELGLHFNFEYWPNNSPKAIAYEWKRGVA